MKFHKSTIEGHYSSMKDLAHAVADLRYDDLFQFLDKLSKKLQEDSQSDFFRNRTQLSKALDQAGQAVGEAAGSIELAWKISAPYLGNNFPEDIRAHIKASYPVNLYSPVILILYRFCSAYPDPLFRLTRCLLFLANGDIARLRAEVEHYIGDFDLIVQAEYQGEEWIRNFNRPFGQEAVQAGDLDAVRIQKLTDKDDLPF